MISRTSNLVLGPSDHQLDIYYRRLNKIGFIGAALVFVSNEVFLRRHLPDYLDEPHGVWSSLVLLVNGQLPSEAAHAAIVVASIMSCVYVVAYSQLPRWTEHKKGINLRKGVPSRIEEYARASFFINNSRELIAFKFWHGVLMRTSFVIAIFLPSMLAGLLRSLPVR